MILFILLFLTTIYFQLGALILSQIILLLIVFLCSNILIGINSFNIEFKVIRILSICTIVFILWNNSIETSIHSLILFPLSISKITFQEDLYKSPYFIEPSSIEKELYLWDQYKINEFLTDLKDNYIVTMEFLPFKDEIDAPYLILFKPFLVNEHSSSTTIKKFINESLDLMVDKFYLDDNIIQPYNNQFGPIVKLTLNKVHF